MKALPEGNEDAMTAGAARNRRGAMLVQGRAMIVLVALAAKEVSGDPRARVGAACHGMIVGGLPNVGKPRCRYHRFRPP